MINFKLRIQKEIRLSPLYHVEIRFESWPDPNTWVCFEHFDRLRDAKAFMVAAMLTGNPFNRDVNKKMPCCLDADTRTKEVHSK